MKSTKKRSSKATPEMLGTGTASRSAKAAKSRNERMKSMADEAMGAARDQRKRSK